MKIVLNIEHHDRDCPRAVCECGSHVEDHGQSDNHGPVEMGEPEDCTCGLDAKFQRNLDEWREHEAEAFAWWRSQQ